MNEMPEIITKLPKEIVKLYDACVKDVRWRVEKKTVRPKKGKKK